MAPLAGLLRSHALCLRTDATRSCRMSGRCNLPMRGAVALIGSFPTADIEDIEDEILDVICDILSYMRVVS